jgi:hypothetical protein
VKRILPLAITCLICATFLVALPFDSASGQIPPIGIIDFYGLRSISEQRVRDALQIKEGDAVPSSRQEIERRLEAFPNVLQSRLNFVFCEAGKVILYVGIKERGAKTLLFRRAPHGRAKLPDSMVQAGDALSDAVTRGAEKGDVAEDDSQGHALYHNPEARAVQERFITFAAQDLKLLRTVLRESSDAHHRALAAEIIAYAANKRDVVKDLIYGMSDADEDVRNNSIRALAIIARFARASPNRQIKVPAQAFIEMLNSIIWTDRNKSSAVLLQLTEGHDPQTLSRLRQRALQSLVEMSRWKSPGHASAAFFILGRVGNLSDNEIQKAWDSGNRQFLIEAVLKRVGPK